MMNFNKIMKACNILSSRVVLNMNKLWI